MSGWLPFAITKYHKLLKKRCYALRIEKSNNIMQKQYTIRNWYYGLVKSESLFVVLLYYPMCQLKTDLTFMNTYYVYFHTKLSLTTNFCLKNWIVFFLNSQIDNYIMRLVIISHSQYHEPLDDFIKADAVYGGSKTIISDLLCYYYFSF